MAGTPVTLEVWQGGVLVETFSISLDSNGGYMFEATATGEVLIRGKASHWLAAVESVDLPCSAAVNLTLLNGDITGDNKINVLDYIQLKSNYNKTGVVGHAADLNGDGNINVLDYIILKLNYNEIGQ